MAKNEQTFDDWLRAGIAKARKHGTLVFDSSEGPPYPLSRQFPIRFWQLLADEFAECKRIKFGRWVTDAWITVLSNEEYAVTKLNQLTSVEFPSLSHLFFRTGVEAPQVVYELDLKLLRTQVGDEGVQALAKLDKLTYLSLGGTQVGDKGVQALAQLDKLEWLFLHQTQGSCPFYAQRAAA